MNLQRWLVGVIPLFIFLVGCHFNELNDFKKNNLFKMIPSKKSGITFSNKINENYQNFFLEFNYVYDGAGVAVGDINNDGLSDIYFVGNQVSNKLYLNQGDFKFEDITTTAGVSGKTEGGWQNGAVMVDINNDGYLDIYITRGGWQNSSEKRKNLLFINKGNLTFEERATDYGLDESGHSIHASFFDMDNDNDLDLYITNRPKSFFLSTSEVLNGKKNQDDSARDKLFINEGGVFKEIGLRAGITNNFGFGLSLVTADINHDGLTDIFVANDFSENDYLYINQGNGTFKESIREATNHTSFYSMGTDIVDINNDGMEDVIISDMLPEDYVRSKTSVTPLNRKRYQEIIINSGFHNQYMHNTLHLNQGNGFFSEISQMAGISKTDWSWSVLGSDFDNDGYRDLFITNGLKRDIHNLDSQIEGIMLIQQQKRQFSSKEELIRTLADDLINLYNSNKLSNYIFKNNGDLTFSDKTQEWGMNQESISQGAAIADFNNDGALDLVVNNMDGKAFLYKNKANKISTHNYLRIKLDGPPKNVNGLGAKIHLKYYNKEQFYQMKVTRGYLSSSEPIAHFGLDSIQVIDKVSVKWTDGLVNTLQNVKVNQLLEISYRNAQPIRNSRKKSQFILAEKTNEWFDPPFIHQENKYDDYQIQILLPHSISKNGPFITTGDVNNDGLEDFFVGGASGYPGQLFIQREKGRFERKKISAFENDKTHEDMAALLFDANGDQSLDLYVVSGGSEFPRASSLYQDRLYLNQGNGDFRVSQNLPKITTSGSCVAAADYDGDGDIDLFVGGRLVPNAYPSPAKSYLLKNEDGNFIDVTKNLAPEFDKLGMVTSAVWSDIDNQGDKELIVAGEWMPIRVFKIITGNRLKEISSTLKLDYTEGWWKKIVLTDYDKDGDKDIIAGNLGLNYEFKASIEEPFHIFADDFDRNGIFDIILAKNYNNNLVPIENKARLEKQIPGITSKFPTYKAFAEANLKEIIGPTLDDALHYKAHTFESQIFVNTEHGFQVQKLPIEAQISTVNGIIVLDYNNDDINDLLIGGNNFHVEYGTTRADASVGLLLKGKKDGTFQQVKSKDSGLFIPNNVKSLVPITLGYKKQKQSQGILIGSNQDTLKFYIIKQKKK